MRVLLGLAGLLGLLIVAGGFSLFGDLSPRIASDPAIAIMPQIIFAGLVTGTGILLTAISWGFCGVMDRQTKLLGALTTLHEKQQREIKALIQRIESIVGKTTSFDSRPASPQAVPPDNPSPLSKLARFLAPSTQEDRPQPRAREFPRDRCPRCGGKIVLEESLPDNSAEGNGNWIEAWKCEQCRSTFSQTVTGKGIRIGTMVSKTQ